MPTRTRPRGSPDRLYYSVTVTGPNGFNQVYNMGRRLCAYGQFNV